jgi:hypothetical protein
MQPPFAIYLHFTNASRPVAEDVPDLAEAKRRARHAWDEEHARGRNVWRMEITASDGAQLTATQPHGRGMLWT